MGSAASHHAQPNIDVAAHEFDETVESNGTWIDDVPWRGAADDGGWDETVDAFADALLTAKLIVGTHDVVTR